MAGERWAEGGIEGDAQVSVLTTVQLEWYYQRWKCRRNEVILGEDNVFNFRPDGSEVLGSFQVSSRQVGTGVWNPVGTVYKMHPESTVSCHLCYLLLV